MNPSIPERIALDQSQCIKSAIGIGQTTYINICTGAQTVVTWGGGDWVGAGIIMLLIIFLLGLIGGVIYMMVSDL